MNAAQALDLALNKVTKWRMFFAGWQLGTRSIEDPEAAAVRDQRELLIILRVEVTALTNLLLKKGLLTTDEIYAEQAEAARELDAAYEKRYPGYIADAHVGMILKLPEALQTMKRMHFKP